MSTLESETMTVSAGAEDHDGVQFQTGSISSFDIVNTVLVANNWNGTPFVDAIVSHIGLEFQWPLALEVDVDGQLVDPPVFAGGGQLKLHITSIIDTPTLPGPRLEAYAVLQSRPAHFAGTVAMFPGPEPQQPGISVANIGVRRPHVLLSDPFQVLAADVGTVVNMPINGGILNQIVASRAGNNIWDGRLRISLQIFDEWAGIVDGVFRGVEYEVRMASFENGVGLPPAQLVLNYTQFNTGWNTHRSDATRAVHDNRLGLPVHSADAIEDAYPNHGVYVQPWDMDEGGEEERIQETPTPERSPDPKPLR